MSVTSFACPECHRVVKSNVPIPAGTKVKCPGCQVVIVVPEASRPAPQKAASPIKAKAPVGPPRKATQLAPAGLSKPVKKTQLKPHPPREEEEEASGEIQDQEPPSSVKKKAPPVRKQKEEELDQLDELDDLDEIPEEEEIEKAPSLKKRKKSAEDEDEVEEIEEQAKPKKKPQKKDEEASSAKKKKGKKNRAEDDEEDDDEDSLGKKKKSKKGESKKTLMLALSGGVGLILVFVVTAFVWPGFLKSSPSAGGGSAGKGGPGGGSDQKAGTSVDSILTYAPGDSFLVAFFDLAAVKKNPDLAPLMELDELANKDEIKEVFQDVEKMVIAASPKPEGIPFLAFAFLMKNPYEAEKVRKAFKVGDELDHQGKKYFKSPSPIGKDDLVSLAGPKLVLSCQGDSIEDFGKILSDGGKQLQFSGDMQQHIQKFQDKPIFLVVANKGPVSAVLQGIDPKNNDPKVQKALPKWEDMFQTLKKSKSAGFSVDLGEGKGCKVEMSLQCADDEEAGKFKSNAEDSFKTLLLFAKLAPVEPEYESLLSAMVDEVEKSFKVEQQGNWVSATVQISEQTLKAAAKAAAAQKAKNQK